MSGDNFDGQILAEKLSKLNNSQQSIESLSRWCISHRKKARQIVETWDKLFNSSSQKEQRVSFLYLANDILQNSRRKGSEFVNEFWKVLPTSLKYVYENGDDNGKKAVMRLVDIWDERKVFGSRAQGLKDELLGKNPPGPLVSNGKSSNPIKIVKRDAHSLRIKLGIGGLPEKILTAFQSVFDDCVDEEAALNECNAAASHVGRIREDMENFHNPGNQHDSTLLDGLKDQETVLQKCVGQLESAEAARAVLIAQLKEAVQDQESKWGLTNTQLQVARGLIEQTRSLKMRLTPPTDSDTFTTPAIPLTEAIKASEHNVPPVLPTSAPPQPPITHQSISLAPLTTTDEESKKAAAAAVAAKLAASTFSAQMFSSVLSSFVAEEAASMNGSIRSTGALQMFSPEKRQKLEKPMAMSDACNADVANTAYFPPVQQQQGTSIALVSLSTSMQSMSQSNQPQASFGSMHPLPPPPPVSSANAQTNQYVQSAGMMTTAMPYGYVANSLPPPPPLPPHVAMGLARPASQPPPQQSQLQQPQQQHQHQQQQQTQQQQQQQQHTTATGGYYRPSGISLYGQNHQPPTPAMPRQ